MKSITDIVESIDLSKVKIKLQDAEEGLGWDVQTCQEAEIEYKRFLVLKKIHPNIDLVPNRLVDKFWHQHILDTQNYAKDCEVIFGYFLHHDPYFGMDGDESFSDLCIAFEETKHLYNEHFGELYSSEPYRCRTQCKPQKCK